MTTIELVQGDITRESVDAIVNAANSSLRTGQAVATTAGDLDTRWVIHTVGPVFSA
jgi:O-acetyl-ADP-ribose deacetylase (regulator of RNase III)